MKKKIVKKLSLVLHKNKKNISDIWLYGSIDDQISDLDLIILYKNLPKKITIPQDLIEKVDDGSIIYISNKMSKNIFLFEDLNIFSIKHKKKIKKKLSFKEGLYRYLTSFLERYYERRASILKCTNITPQSLRLIKSTIFSYENFYKFCEIKKIKIKNKKFKFDNYLKIRKNFIKGITNKNNFKIFLKKFKLFDKNFHKESIEILDNYFKFKSIYHLDYKFNSYTFYSLTNKKKILVPKILAYIYNIYSTQNLAISKKIKKDFKSNIMNKKKYLDLNKYLIKKIKFLNINYLNLKKKKFKTGLYRLNWYLS